MTYWIFAGLMTAFVSTAARLQGGSAVRFPFSEFAVRFVCLLDDLLCFLPRKAVLRFQL